MALHFLYLLVYVCISVSPQNKPKMIDTYNYVNTVIYSMVYPKMFFFHKITLWPGSWEKWNITEISVNFLYFISDINVKMFRLCIFYFLVRIDSIFGGLDNFDEGPAKIPAVTTLFSSPSTDFVFPGPVSRPMDIGKPGRILLDTPEKLTTVDAVSKR